jgi:hypothetical protein
MTTHHHHQVVSHLPHLEVDRQLDVKDLYHLVDALQAEKDIMKIADLIIVMKTVIQEIDTKVLVVIITKAEVVSVMITETVIKNVTTDMIITEVATAMMIEEVVMIVMMTEEAVSPLKQDKEDPLIEDQNKKERILPPFMQETFLMTSLNAM